MPESRRSGRSERLHLEARARVVEADGDDALAPLLDLKAKLQTFPGKELDASEVDIGANGVGLTVVQRSGSRSVGRSRLGLREFVFRTWRGVAHPVLPSVVSRWPVEPNPAVPGCVSSSSFTLANSALVTGITINWAIRSPTAIENGSSASVLSRVTRSSPR